MTYWFVNVDGKWSKPYTYYPVAKYNSTKRTSKSMRLIWTLFQRKTSYGNLNKKEK